MSGWLPFSYRDFHDVPRLLAFSYAGHWYILDCQFDDDLDEYEGSFRLLRVVDADVPDLEGSDWRNIVDRASFVAALPVDSVQFDSTKRQKIADSVLEFVRN